VNAEELRRECLRHRGAREEFPFGASTTVFKVGTKMFALSSLAATPLSVSVKCDPELGERLRASYSSIVPGYHLNKRHWLTIALDGTVPDETVRQLIEDSYDLVRPSR